MHTGIGTYSQKSTWDVHKFKRTVRNLRIQGHGRWLVVEKKYLQLKMLC